MTPFIEEKLRKLGGVMGKKISKLQWAYQAESDGERKRQLESKINILYAKNFSFEEKILLVPPSREISKGDYLLGAVQYNEKNVHPYGLRSQDLQQHTLIAGRSGSGKSNLMLYLAKQFITNNNPFILFSFKREYRQLQEHFKHNKKVLLFTCGRPHADFHFNPLAIPKGADRESWINLLAETIASVYFLKEGGISFLRAGLLEVYATHKTPKLSHLKEWVENQSSKGRAGEWLVSTKRILDALTFGRIGEVLNSNDSLPIDSLLDKHTIIEMDNFNDDDRTFIIQCFFRWLYQYALENFPRDSTPQLMLLVDEAHHLFLKQGNEETFNDSLIRKIRELGIGLVLGDQHPSLLSLPALGNTLTTISLNLKTQADVTAIGGALLLEPEQKKFIGLLERGYAIVRNPDRFPTPFLIQIPKVSLPTEQMTDFQIGVHMKPLTADLRGLSVSTGLDLHKNDAFRGFHPQDSGWPADSAESDELSPLHEGILTSVLNNPFMGTNNRYKQLKVSIRHGTQAKDWLVSRGYLKPVTVSIYKNSMVLFDFTDKAYKYFEAKNIRVKHPANEGGVEHRFGAWQTKKHYENLGFSVETEFKTEQGKFIDLVAKKENEAHALLIETGKSNIESNIEAAKNAGFSTIKIIATNKDVLNKSHPVSVIYLPDLQKNTKGDEL